MIHFVKPLNTAQSFSSWQKTSELFKMDGCNSRLHVIPQTEKLFLGGVFRCDKIFRLVNRLQVKFQVRQFLQQVHKGDAVWINSCISHDLNLEYGIKNRGAFYIFNLLDDWLSVPALRNAAVARIQLADLVAVPTANLQQAILSEFPKASVEIFDEVVDVEKIKPIELQVNYNPPKIVWSGRQNNISKLESISNQLFMAYQKAPYNLVLDCGSCRPTTVLPVPFHWEPFDHANLSNVMAAARCGLDPVGRSRYDSCKGNYKVKVYLAAGVPVIASPVGINKKLIDPEKNGFLPNSEQEWADSIVLLVKDKTLYEKMSENARQFAINNLSHSVVIPDWILKLKQRNLI